jgi:hypothetical protein
MQQTPFQPFLSAAHSHSHTHTHSHTHRHTHTHQHTIQVNLASTANPISRLRSFVLSFFRPLQMQTCIVMASRRGCECNPNIHLSSFFNVFIVISLLFVVSNNKTFEVSCYGNGYRLTATTAITLL